MSTPNILARKSEEDPLPYFKTGVESEGFSQLGFLVSTYHTEEQCITICIMEPITSFGSPHMTDQHFVFISVMICLECPPCSLFSLCFFLLVVVALLLAQWLNFLGTKYRMFTLSMWTTLLNPIGR
jgi:hypothetical protein